MLIEITRKKVLIVLTLLIVVIAVPLTVYLSQRQQETRSRASQAPSDLEVVATFDGQNITRGEVKEVALEQYEQNQIDNQASKDALAILIERKVLSKASEKLGISADPADIEQKVQNEGLSQQDAFYEVLKNKIILSQVKSREALTIDFWSPTEEDLPSLSAEEKANASSQFSDGIPALNEAVTILKGGGDVLQVAEDILAKYPSLREVWAVNGYILDSLEDGEKQAVASPKIFEFGDSPLDATAREALFAMNEGDVKLVSGTTTNKGGVVFKLVSKGNDSGANSYQQWLDSQIAGSVSDFEVYEN